MSRHLKTLTMGRSIRRTFIYGFTPALGYFYETRDDYGNVLEERDSFGITGKKLSKSYFVGILETYGVDKLVIENVALDLPI